MIKRNLNKKQVSTLKELIHNHLHEILTDKEKATKTFEKIKKYGVKTIPEAIQLYKENRHALEAMGV
ncbi:hypothetical protein [Clostridium magnum]|uniref:Uncharacterized protein n=1 Tax=Clostridium magnum DSM 2767 TaxID=1121326 RepID=A0A162QLG6_9CLOT|nr:hypothetical protein [Clostridium magnum]KZL88674.1 hypothetical protein CLMAG_59630 [Clostridium magnum DSM 2767]SHJ60616.1 hypothetical protein SAMN02745944_06224 [Clostridium magnum DSM 2767]